MENANILKRIKQEELPSLIVRLFRTGVKVQASSPIGSELYPQIYRFRGNSLVVRRKTRTAYTNDKVHVDRPTPPGGNLLNVGPAGGSTSVMRSEFGKVKSLEFDAALYEHCKCTRGLDVDQSSILQLPCMDGAFDASCAFDVIEHVEPDVQASKELGRVTKKGGRIFISVPAYAFLWRRHDEVNHHFRRYTLESLTTAGKAAGLNPVYST